MLLLERYVRLVVNDSKALNPMAMPVKQGRSATSRAGAGAGRAPAEVAHDGGDDVDDDVDDPSLVVFTVRQLVKLTAQLWLPVEVRSAACANLVALSVLRMPAFATHVPFSRPLRRSLPSRQGC